uniref:Uncharacterized protein n=1 Tax=Ananas comosus var. bracteatus TaxID=296719 RepID=A0A6V7PB50_ANACO|nr:unnamed protein product [Ananas comosus var. bracteatus]
MERKRVDIKLPVVELESFIPGVWLWGLVDSSGECRDKSESRWRQIDAKRTPCDARAAFSEGICKTADFPACCTGTRLCCTVQPARGMLAVPVQGYSVPVQVTRTDSAALGLAPVPVQEPCTGTRELLVESPVGDFVADVAPQAVRARLLPELCEEAGRGSVFTVLDVAPRFDAVEVGDSASFLDFGQERRIATRLGSLDSGLREEYTKPSLARLVHRTWRSPVDPAEVVLVRGFVRCLDLAFESHRFRLLRLPRIRIEARASRARALPD